MLAPIDDCSDGETYLGWVMLQLERHPIGCEFHIIPVGDLREHESDECWCRPAEDEEEPGLWNHNALDGREAYERGERQPC